MIHIYTGDGKGKTTAALGLALRAVGHGNRVLMIQFMKKGHYGELAASGMLKNFEIMQSGRGEFVNKNSPESVDFELAETGVEMARNALNSNNYDLLILDEINVAVDFGLVSVECVKGILNAAGDTEIVLTGRYAKKELIDEADYVSEIAEIKHPYQRGIESREGIEF